jgi:DNA modification methylase
MQNSDIPLKPLSSKPMKLSAIRPNPTNPRLIKEERFKALVRSLEHLPDFSAVNALKLDENNQIVGGNMRYKAMKHLGWKWATVQVYDREYHAQTISFLELGKSYEDVIREMIIKDNRSFGEDDFDILANDWDAEELNEWGLDVWTGEPEETEGLTDPDDVPEVPEEAKTKLGDLYILGEHRLLCGDSTSKEAVEILMDGEKADMVFTDPPYGISYSSSKYDGNTKGLTNKRNKAKMIIGDGEDFDPSFIVSTFRSAKEIFIWGFQYYPQKLGRGGIIVWNKKRETETSNPHGDFELCWSRNERNKMCWLRWGGFNNKEKNEERLHTTQKPVDLALWFFDNWGKDMTIVADVFLGSGSTLIAAEKTNRKCYGMELDPKYCDVIVKRWEDFTGKKASKQ